MIVWSAEDGKGMTILVILGDLYKPARIPDARTLNPKP